MHYKAFLSFALLGGSIAQSIPPQSGIRARDIQTLVTIKSSLKHGTEGVEAVNTALKAVTAANAKEALGSVNTALMKLASDVSADTKKMKSSGTIGIGEILGLASEGPRNELLGAITGLFQALNKTAFTVGEKRDIIKASGAVDIVVPGIKAQRQGLVDIVSIVPSQVPAIAKGPINSIISSIMAKGSSPPAAAAPPPALFRRQGKGKGTPKSGGGAPKAPSSGGSSGGGSSGGGVTLDSLLASPEALESIGKGIDTVLDRLISWLRGTTEDLVPPELLESLAKMSKGFPKGGPKGAAPSPATPPAVLF